MRELNRLNECPSEKEHATRIGGTPYALRAAMTHVNGKPTTVMTGYSEMKRDFDTECGITGWTPHDLRRI